MPYFPVSGSSIFYTVHGAGPPLLLHHGWCCDGNDWAWMVPELAKHYQVIVVDARGHGRSSTADDYSFDSMVADIEALLIELAAGPALLAGHSLGAAVLSGLALRRPDLVAGLVAIDPAYGQAAEVAEDLARLTTYLSTTPADAARTVAHILPSWAGPNAPPFLQFLLERSTLGMDSRAVAASFIGLERTRLFSRDDAASALRGRTCPVLAFHTHESTALWEASLHTNSHSRSVSMSGQGHWIHIEAAAELSATMIEWFAEIPAP